MLQYTYQNNWEILGCFTDDIVGPGCFPFILIHLPHILIELHSHLGSLNRFMKQAVFKRDKLDPTATNPPRYTKIASYSAMPSRDDIDAAMAKSSYLKSKYEKIIQKNNIFNEKIINLNEKMSQFDVNQVVTVEKCDDILQLTVQHAAELKNIDKKYYKLLNKCFQYIESLLRQGGDARKSPATGDVMGVVDITGELYDEPTSISIENRLGTSKLELIYEAIISNNEMIKINLPASSDENNAVRIGYSGDIFQFNSNNKYVVRYTSMGIIPVSTRGNYILKNDKMIINFEPINLFGLSWNKSVEQYSLEFKYINNNVVVVRYTGNTGQSTYVIFKILQ